jgi:hypothetical protein
MMTIIFILLMKIIWMKIRIIETVWMINFIIIFKIKILKLIIKIKLNLYN